MTMHAYASGAGQPASWCCLFPLSSVGSSLRASRFLRPRLSAAIRSKSTLPTHHIASGSGSIRSYRDSRSFEPIPGSLRGEEYA